MFRQQFALLITQIFLIIAITWEGCLSSECDISYSSEVASNPVLKALAKTESSLKCVTALQSGYLSVAEKYWGEIDCLEGLKNSNKEDKAKRLLPSLQHITRDYCSLKLVESQRTYNIHSLLKFINYTNVGLPAYEFLLTEMKSIASLGSKNSLIFQVALNIKQKFGIESTIFKSLPKAVQMIMSGKPLRLKNNATNNYLTFNEFKTPKSSEDDKGESVNAKTNANVDSKKGSWVIETLVNERTWSRREGYGAGELYVYFVKIRSTESCSKVNCTQYLTNKKDTTTTNTNHYHYDDSPPTSDAKKPTLITYNNGYVLQLESDEVISIKAYNEGYYSWTGDQLLTEVNKNGELEFLENGFKMFNRFERPTEEVESSQDDGEKLSKSNWIVSYA